MVRDLSIGVVLDYRWQCADGDKKAPSTADG
jgi:hypothetical protein